MHKSSISLLFALSFACLAACADDKPKPHASVPDAAVSDAGPAENCSSEPQSHAEIINACTDAEVVDKHPDLPLLLPDGGLPPLP